MTTAITVLIADDDPDVRASLARQLAGWGGIEVAGTAPDAEGAVELAAATQTDVALVDFDMPGGGERAARGILEASPRTHVIALSGAADAETSRAMLSAGATSYLVKGSSPDDIVAAVVRAARGESILAAEVADVVMGEFAAYLEQSRVKTAEAGHLRDRIRAVIDGSLLFPVFQPLVELAGERLVAFEALCRFPKAFGAPPARWFADAETVGLRADLELAAAAAALAGFREYAGSESLSINASPDVVGPVAELGSWLGERLIVEVTEHAAIKDYAEVAEGISRYRASGVRLAVDDAGAGFASFRHVLELEPDYIKLDGSLVRSIDKDRGRRALARGLIGFAKELGIATVAECVESPAELRTLRSLGVDLVQGWLTGPPGQLPVTA